MKFVCIVHLQLFYKKIQNIDTFIKNEFVQSFKIIYFANLEAGGNTQNLLQAQNVNRQITQNCLVLKLPACFSIF